MPEVPKLPTPLTPGLTPTDVVLSHQALMQGCSKAGGWTMAQLRVFGVSWPPRKGWKASLEGQSCSEETYQAFLRLGRGGRARELQREMLFAELQFEDKIERDA